MKNEAITPRRRLLGYREVHEEYGFHPGTLASYVHRKLIPHIRLGPRHVVFDRAELEEWLADHRVSTQGDGGDK